MKITQLGKKSRKQKPINFYKYKIESEISALQQKYEDLRRHMEEQQLENIQTDELLLKYLRQGVRL